jgi:hypothetical protein
VPLRSSLLPSEDADLLHVGPHRHAALHQDYTLVERHRPHPAGRDTRSRAHDWASRRMHPAPPHRASPRTVSTPPPRCGRTR